MEKMDHIRALYSEDRPIDNRRRISYRQSCLSGFGWWPGVLVQYLLPVDAGITFLNTYSYAILGGRIE